MSYKTTVLADNPASLWMCDESVGTGTAADSGSGGVTLTAANVTQGAAGLATNVTVSASFNGTTSKLSGGTFAAQANPSGAYGIEAWIKTSTSNAGAIWTGRSTSGQGPILYVAGGLVSLFNGSIDNTNVYTGVTTVSDGVARYVAFIWDGTNLNFYINGALDVQRNKLSASGTTGAGVYGIGWDNQNSNHNFYTGNIAAVGYYAGANQLTATMVANHYAAGASTPPFRPGPIGLHLPAVSRAATR